MWFAKHDSSYKAVATEATDDEEQAPQVLSPPRSLKPSKPKIPLFIDGKIKTISDIDVVDQTFTIRFHLHFGIPLTDQQRNKFLLLQEREEKEDFLPPISIINLVDGKAPQIDFKGISKANKRYILSERYAQYSEHWMLRVKVDFNVTLFEEMELQQFPLDCQDLAIKIRCENNKYEFTNTVFASKPGSKPASAKSVWFSIDRENLCLKDFALAKECISEFFNEDPAKNKGGRSYSHFVVRVKVKRRLPFYFWNFYLINGLLSGSALTCFVFEYDSDGLNSRFGILFNVLLTLVAAKFTVYDQVPKLSYNTLLDVYIIANFVFVITLTVLTGIYPKITDANAVEMYNMLLWVVMLLLWVVGHVVYVVFGMFARSREQMKLNMNTVELERFGFGAEEPLNLLEKYVYRGN